MNSLRGECEIMPIRKEILNLPRAPAGEKKHHQGRKMEKCWIKPFWRHAIYSNSNRFQGRGAKGELIRYTSRI